MAKVKIKQFKNKAKEPVAGLTPEHAIYDKNGVRLDAKLGNVNLQEFRDLQQQCVNNIKSQQNASETYISGKVNEAKSEIDAKYAEVSQLTQASMIGANTGGLEGSNVQDNLNDAGERLSELESKLFAPDVTVSQSTNTGYTTLKTGISIKKERYYTLKADIDSNASVPIYFYLKDKNGNIIIGSSIGIGETTASYKKYITSDYDDTYLYAYSQVSVGLTLSLSTDTIDGDITLLNNSVESIKKNAKIVTPIFEVGGVTISSNGWEYYTNTLRVRTKYGTTIQLSVGDVVGLTDYTDARYYVGWKKSDGTYGYRGWLTDDYTIEEDGEYVFLLACITEVEQSDYSTLGNLFFANIKGGLNYIESKVDANTSNIHNINEDISEIKDFVSVDITKGSANVKDTSIKYEELNIIKDLTLKANTPYTFEISLDKAAKYPVYIYVSTTDGTRILSNSIQAGDLLATYKLQNIDERSIRVYIQYGEVVDLLVSVKVTGNTISQQINNKKGYFEYGKIQRLYHHLNVESSTPLIPSQSLADIAYAKALGFDAIEVNCQVTSDGILVCKHGGSISSGVGNHNLGSGLKFAEGSSLTPTTMFGDVTAETLRREVTYNSSIERYCTPIPTLEEFLAEANKLGMRVVLQIASGWKDVARKYLADHNIIAYGLADRDDFKGIAVGWHSDTDISTALTRMESVKYPAIYGWFNAHTADEALVNIFAQTMHKNGYLIGACYLGNFNNILKVGKLGIDWIASCETAINPFDNGNYLNIFGGDSDKLVYGGGTSYDSSSDSISVPVGGTATLNLSEFANRFGKASVKIKYNGKITMTIGDMSLTEYESDGVETIELAAALQHNSNIMTITGVDITTITDISIAVSMIL